MHSQISNFFQCRSDTTKNDQLLSSHLNSTYPVIKFGHLSWSFLVSSLRIINFGHLFLSGDVQETVVTKKIDLLFTNLPFSTSETIE